MHQKIQKRIVSAETICRNTVIPNNRWSYSFDWKLLSPAYSTIQYYWKVSRRFDNCMLLLNCNLNSTASDWSKMTSTQDSKKATAPITATSRLNSDYKNLMKDPIPYIVAQPLTSNILECHYVITGK